jgi:4-methyl-5(b-hydroxyethyl)-thiazole monophosphate biosynthesis
MPTVVAILAEGFEEIEAVAPIDLLRRAGAEVTTAALGESMHVTGRSGITVHADTTLGAVIDRNFDCVFLPGGPAVKHLRADPRIAGWLRQHDAAGKWIAAICAAPTALKDAGLLTGKRFTAHDSVANELPELIKHERVVADGRVLTSRGAGTAVDFGLFLISKLFSPERSAEIGRSISV